MGVAILQNLKSHRVKMGGGGKVPYEIPDHRIYKIDGIKHLEWTRDELAKHGLKDPWLRNEAWRYTNWPGYWGNIKLTAKRGLKAGIVLSLITIAVDHSFGIHEKYFGHGHGHGHDEH